MISNEQIKILGLELWQLNDIEVWAGHSFDEIVSEALKQTGLTKEELLDGPFRLLPPQWDKELIIDVDAKYSPRYTYRNYLEKCLDEGVEFPCLWSSTEY